MFCVSNTIIPKWIPLQERGRASSAATIGTFNINVLGTGWDLCYLTLNLGCNMGAIAGSCLSGFCNSYFGWQSNFYIVSVIALSFGLLWCLTVCDNPQDDKKVSPYYL